MSELKNHQKMIDYFKKQNIEIDREIDRKMDQDVEMNQLPRLALLATAITNLYAAGAVSGDLIAITCLKKATQENEIN